MHRPRKRFGQNFLHDSAVIRRIVSVIAPTRGEHLVEIGPGHGAITTELLKAAGRLDAVELDRDLIAPLMRKCADLGELRVHCADALTFDFCSLAAPDARLRITGNLPYNISTPILFHLLAQRRCLDDLHFMLQKEVVTRMAASPGGRAYGRLSVMLQAYFEVTALFEIGRNAFRPVPRVESSFVRLVPYVEPPIPIAHPESFAHVVTKAFGQRRKTLRNSLKGVLPVEAIAELDIDPGARAEQLDVRDFARLAQQAWKTGQAP